MMYTFEKSILVIKKLLKRYRIEVYPAVCYSDGYLTSFYQLESTQKSKHFSNDNNNISQWM